MSVVVTSSEHPILLSAPGTKVLNTARNTQSARVWERMRDRARGKRGISPPRRWKPTYRQIERPRPLPPRRCHAFDKICPVLWSPFYTLNCSDCFYNERELFSVTPTVFGLIGGFDAHLERGGGAVTIQWRFHLSGPTGIARPLLRNLTRILILLLLRASVCLGS